jgi:uncharacterized protein YegL
MTDPNYTAIAVLIDRSGSMSLIKDDAEGGLNAFVEDQKQQSGRASLTLVQFDTGVDVVEDFVDVQDVKPFILTPRGATALLDAWGQTMASLGERLAAMPEDERPGHVQFVVITDGMENSSQEWTREKLFAAVKEQTETYGWQFTFLAANQDAVSVGQQYGVAAASSMTYGANSDGTQSMFRSVSNKVAKGRSGDRSGYTDADRAAAMGAPTPGSAA